VYYSLGWTRPLPRQQQVHTHDLNILNDFAVRHLCCASPEWTWSVFSYTKNKVLHTFSLIWVFICFSGVLIDSCNIIYTAWLILLDRQISCTGRFFSQDKYMYFFHRPAAKSVTHAAYTHKMYTHAAYTVTKRILYRTHTVYSRIFSLWCSIHYSFKKSSHWNFFYRGRS
jgi:hypothetical protein